MGLKSTWWIADERELECDLCDDEGCEMCDPDLYYDLNDPRTEI